MPLNSNIQPKRAERTKDNPKHYNYPSFLVFMESSMPARIARKKNPSSAYCWDWNHKICINNHKERQMLMLHWCPNLCCLVQLTPVCLSNHQRHEGDREQGHERRGEDGDPGDAAQRGQTHRWGGGPQIWGGAHTENIFRWLSVFTWLWCRFCFCSTVTVFMCF